MKLLNSDIAIPLYQQLYDLLLDQIRSGVYPPGSKIPSEEELCKTYDLSRVTVRNALGRLVDDNILVKRHGKGTFVATPVFTESAYANGSFTKSCEQMGATPSTGNLPSTKVSIHQTGSSAKASKSHFRIKSCLGKG